MEKLDTSLRSCVGFLLDFPYFTRTCLSDIIRLPQTAAAEKHLDSENIGSELKMSEKTVMSKENLLKSLENYCSRQRF